MPRIGIVAGEASGDYLAGHLLATMKQLCPDLRAEGIGGSRFIAAGGYSLASMDRLSVMGLVEVLGRLAELRYLRERVLQHFLDHPPDVFVGIDAPDFNLDLEIALRKHGIRTAHYVSPSVWAWRSYRVQKLARAVDRILVLFPFEQDFYERAGVPSTYVGHPLAHLIPMRPDPAAARRRLELASGGPVVALMPGSRKAELKRLTAVFLQAAAWIAARRPETTFISSLLSQPARAYVQAEQQRLGLGHLPLALYHDRAHDVLEAADTVLLASGTITLEAMLFKRPMVVAYRMNPVSFAIIRRLVRVRFAALPNLLAGERLVPELLQDRCRPQDLGAAVLDWLTQQTAVRRLQERFDELHLQLQGGGNMHAANAVLDLVRRP